MPVTESAKKALRRDKRRATVNLRIKHRLKAAVKQFRLKPTEKKLRLTHSLIDRAAKKKVFKKNKSARLKLRLTKLLKASGK